AVRRINGCPGRRIAAQSKRQLLRGDIGVGRGDTDNEEPAFQGEQIRNWIETWRCVCGQRKRISRIGAKINFVTVQVAVGVTIDADAPAAAARNHCISLLASWRSKGAQRDGSKGFSLTV